MSPERELHQKLKLLAEKIWPDAMIFVGFQPHSAVVMDGNISDTNPRSVLAELRTTRALPVQKMGEAFLQYLQMLDQHGCQEPLR